MDYDRFSELLAVQDSLVSHLKPKGWYSSVLLLMLITCGFTSNGS